MEIQGSPQLTGELSRQAGHLSSRAMAANEVSELAFSLANDTYEVLGFRQALVYAVENGREVIQCVSGLVRLTDDSPYLLWLNRAWPVISGHLAGSSPGQIAWLELPEVSAEWPEAVVGGWREWWPQGLLSLTLHRRDGSLLGRVVFLLDEPPSAAVLALLESMRGFWAYCWEMLSGTPKPSWQQRWREFYSRRRQWLLLLVALIVLFPVRQSAMAPAEIVAMSASVVASPLEGVVKKIHVRPNQTVKAGELLFSLDDTTLRNRLEVAQKSMSVADAELGAMTQKSFDMPQSRGELAALTGRAFERRAELAAIQAQLARINVHAERDGVVVFGDPDDWLGKPVAVGERIMLLADPAQPGVLVHLAVADAIALDVGAPVRMFLSVKPLTPVDAHLVETSYQAVLSPINGVASYRLRAALDDSGTSARIGLRGTAKLYGNWVVFGYYVLRRPLASLREWTGW